jgi:hypothetical protein
MVYAIKDTVSGKYMGKTKMLESDSANAITYTSKVSADSAAVRLQKIYDNWESNDGVVSSRGYTNVYKAITPAPIWKSESIG